jgi:hypothetical protein
MFLNTVWAFRRKFEKVQMGTKELRPKVITPNLIWSSFFVLTLTPVDGTASTSCDNFLAVRVATDEQPNVNGLDPFWLPRFMGVISGMGSLFTYEGVFLKV